ncbi:MAG: extracellular solute-binding protein [Clostridia bacterium]|nr:extracellular solute-binding protein [Clostridia bacterium]
MTKKAFLSALISLLLLAACANESSLPNLNSLSYDALLAAAQEEGFVNATGFMGNHDDAADALYENYSVILSHHDMVGKEAYSLFSVSNRAAAYDLGILEMEYAANAKSSALTLAYKTSYWYDIPTWAKDSRGDYTAVFSAVSAFITNTSTVKNPPRSWSDIAKGDYTVTIGDVLSSPEAQYAYLDSAIALGGGYPDYGLAGDFWAALAESGRLSIRPVSASAVFDGSVDVAVTADFNALTYKYGAKDLNFKLDFDVAIPSDGAVRHTYCAVINKFAPHPHAAAALLEYLLSDEGQTNFAKNYARPVRDVTLPPEIEERLLPEDAYTNVMQLDNYSMRDAQHIASLWREKVLKVFSEN